MKQVFFGTPVEKLALVLWDNFQLLRSNYFAIPRKKRENIKNRVGTI